MNAYIEIVSAVAIYGFELTDDDLREIGAFTRGNVSRWMSSSHSLSVFEVGIYGWKDFHAVYSVSGDIDSPCAVCGDIDIPWATEEARLAWGRIPEMRLE